MNAINLKRDARILVCDGAKALFLTNEGNATEPRLAVLHEMDGDTRKTAEIGSDRPGRMTTPAGPASAMEPPDYHAQAEEQFVRAALARFDAHCREAGTMEVVIAAPPKALAVIRAAASKDLMQRCIAQVPKDYVSHPVPEITRLLTQ